MKTYFFIIASIIYLHVNGQKFGNISGNAELSIQTFQEDSTINAEARNSYTKSYINLI